MPSAIRKIIVLATGGTIAGTAARCDDHTGYAAAQLDVAQLLAAVPALQGVPLEAEQLAQVDSRDMSPALWQRLASCCAQQLARDDVAGVVVTHGTDTLEETAYFLHRVLAPAKPLVLTAAMRPATALLADGPQNLLDAVTLARWPGAAGVCVVMAGSVFGAADVRKMHTQRPDAFTAGDAGSLARVLQGSVQRWRPWPSGTPLGLRCIEQDPATWPRIEIVLNHAGADGRVVEALRAVGVEGIVAAGTGNGTLSAPLTAALQRARQAGIHVLRSTRCAAGPVLATPFDDGFESAGEMTAVQARVELLLQLLAASA